MVGNACVGPARPHIGAAPDLAADKATFTQQGVGAPDRADGDADVVGEVTLRRQLFPAGREPLPMLASILSARRR